MAGTDSNKFGWVFADTATPRSTNAASNEKYTAPLPEFAVVKAIAGLVRSVIGRVRDNTVIPLRLLLFSANEGPDCSRARTCSDFSASLNLATKARVSLCLLAFLAKSSL